MTTTATSNIEREFIVFYRVNGKDDYARRVTVSNMLKEPNSFSPQTVIATAEMLEKTIEAIRRSKYGLNKEVEVKAFTVIHDDALSNGPSVFYVEKQPPRPRYKVVTE